MKIAIAGGNGFIGKALTTYLLDNQHQVFILTRHLKTYSPIKGVTYIRWLHKEDQPEKQLEGLDAIINLAGTSLNSGRWSAARKKEILESRLSAAKEITRIVAALQHKPNVLLSASAVGYYGVSNKNTFTEQDHMPPSDFLSDTVHQWEKAASHSSVRTIYMRFGVILGKDEGALPKIALPYKLYGGGTVGSGKQMLSWIHITDVVRAILFCINHFSISGAVNFTAPYPLSMKAFGQTVGKVLQKPHWLPVPALPLKLLLGEMSILLLEGQTVIPQVLLENHYSFTYPHLEQALQHLLTEKA